MDVSTRHTPKKWFMRFSGKHINFWPVHSFVCAATSFNLSSFVCHLFLNHFSLSFYHFQFDRPFMCVFFFRVWMVILRHLLGNVNVWSDYFAINETMKLKLVSRWSVYIYIFSIFLHSPFRKTIYIGYRLYQSSSVIRRLMWSVSESVYAIDWYRCAFAFVCAC